MEMDAISVIGVLLIIMEIKTKLRLLVSHAMEMDVISVIGVKIIITEIKTN